MTRTILVLALLLTGCQCNGVTPTPTASSTPAVTATPTKPPTATPKPTETPFVATPTPHSTKLIPTLAAVEARVADAEATLTALQDGMGRMSGVSALQQQLLAMIEPVMQGKATYYAEPYIGRAMKNGDIYTGQEMTCAVDYFVWARYGGKTLRVCLRDEPERCVNVTVTDCGMLSPHGVSVDLSVVAFKALGLDLAQGVVWVKVWVVG